MADRVTRISPPLKLSLSWQKQIEGTFSELWNLIKLSAKKGGESNQWCA